MVLTKCYQLGKPSDGGPEFQASAEESEATQNTSPLDVTNTGLDPVIMTIHTCIVSYHTEKRQAGWQRILPENSNHPRAQMLTQAFVDSKQ